MRFYQIVILLIAAFMIYEGVHDYLRQHTGQTFFKFAVRLSIWGGMAGIVAFPSLSNALAALIGIQGNVNAVILTGFLLVFLLIFKLLSAIERIEQNISILTRKDALKKIASQNEK